MQTKLKTKQTKKAKNAQFAIITSDINEQIGEQNTQASESILLQSDIINLPAVIVNNESEQATIIKQAKPAKLPRFQHDINAYKYDSSIASLSFGKKKSKTAIQINNFNKLPHAALTIRDTQFLAHLYKLYNGSEFLRGDCDAGNLSRAIARGYIAYISGNPASDNCTFQLTKKALSDKYILLEAKN
jgi:hypothetical protein